MRAKKAVRLTAKIDQTVCFPNYKAIITVVDRVFIHSDERMFGTVRYQGRVFHVEYNSTKRVWQL